MTAPTPGTGLTTVAQLAPPARPARRHWMLILGLSLTLGWLGLGDLGCRRSSNSQSEATGADARSKAAKTSLEPVRTGASQTQIDDRLVPDSELDQLIAPYRDQMEAQMNEVLADCPTPMRTGRPEGALGNLIADFVLARARLSSRVPADACVLNNGGLRVPWSQGPITLGLVFEVMPFDNDLVVLRLTSDQVRQLADEIAARGGEPVAGMEFEIQGERAIGLEVAGAPVADRDYWIATSDYLADGGGGMPTLWEGQERVSLGILIRDLIADAVRAYGEWGEDSGSGRPGTLPRPEMGRIREVR